MLQRCLLMSKCICQICNWIFQWRPFLFPDWRPDRRILQRASEVHLQASVLQRRYFFKQFFPQWSVHLLNTSILSFVHANSGINLLSSIQLKSSSAGSSVTRSHFSFSKRQDRKAVRDVFCQADAGERDDTARRDS